MQTLREAVLTETYKDMRGLVIQTAVNFHKRYGGDLEELISEANLWFILSVDTHDPKKAKLSTWIVVSVWRRLLCFMTKEYRQSHQPLNTSNEEEEEETQNDPEAKKEFRLILDIVGDLDESAKEVLWLLIEPPVALDAEFTRWKYRPKHVRQDLRRFLCQRMNWTVKEVRTAFREIEMIIKD